MSNLSKPNYGIDAPGVIRNLFLIGVGLILISLLIQPFKIGNILFDLSWFIFPGVIFTLEGVLMLIYSLKGKYAHRDRMFKQVNWIGDEQVLDIGTGKGLLMIGAAKKLSRGKSIGIDIWNEADLSGNNKENALANARIEGVEDKVEIINENAMEMSFADNAFDVILSNLCLHNIYNKEGRAKACVEIARVLKPGGIAVISDFRHVRDYKNVFDEAGLETNLFVPEYFRTFPPLRIVVAKKT